MLCLLYVEKTSNLDPIDKYREYIRLVAEKLDVVSGAEASIAMYCFSPSAHDMPKTEAIRSQIRENFLRGKVNGKTCRAPRDIQSLKRIAYNGACDISFVNVANAVDSRDGSKQESWIVTQDRKLAEHCKVFHHFPVSGSAGQVAGVYLNSEQRKSSYWMEAIDILSTTLADRASEYFSKENDLDDLRRRVVDIFEFASHGFKE